MSEGRVAAVIFDLYGTLVDIVTDEQSREFWSRLAADLRAGGTAIEGRRLQTLYQQLCETEVQNGEEGFVLDRVFPRLLASLGRETTRDSVERFALRFRSQSTVTLEVKLYTASLLDKLKRSHCKVAVVSNTEALFTRFDLQKCGLADSFDAIVLSSEVGLKKPDPRVFRLALQRIHVEDGAAAVFIGDNAAEDISGAQKVGLRSLFVNPDGPAISVHADFQRVPRVIGVYPSLTSIQSGLQELGWLPPA